MNEKSTYLTPKDHKFGTEKSTSMMKQIIISCIFFIGFATKTFAQSSPLPIGHKLYQFADFEEVNTGSSFYSTIKPYSRKNTYQLLSKNSSKYVSQELRVFSKNETTSKKPFLKKMFVLPESFYHYQDENLDLHFNPAIHFSLGKESGDQKWLYVNSRGLEIRGSIDKKVGFYTFLSENQARYPSFVNTVKDSTIAVPYEGFWKQINGDDVDYLRARGYIDIGIHKSISAQLGYGKHFVGNGQRSLILSDFSNNYPYFKLTAQTKIFAYTSLFAQLIGDVKGGTFGTLGVGGFSTKYLAFHHLNVRIKPNFHIGLFESVMHGDSTSGFKFAYANPIIFYRAVEQQNGSSDNAMIGMDFKWNIAKKFSLYGQLVIDELIVSRAFSNSGWWGNKQGYQLGVKYAHKFNSSNKLLAQLELNRVRPYMYAHSNGYTSYTHYNLPLAHPLGANFTEYLARVNYLLGDKWQFELMVLSATYGNDFGKYNYGKNILKNYTIRPRKGFKPSDEFGNAHLQGNRTNLLMSTVKASYMLKHNLFLDFDYTYRNENDQMKITTNSSNILSLSVRWNMPARKYLF